MDIFANKKILFWGPGNTDDKKDIDKNNYDYIIITNNMITMIDEFPPQKVILLSNKLYTKKYYHHIKEHHKKLFKIIVTSKESYGILFNLGIHNVLVQVGQSHYIKKIPLGLSRILHMLESSAFSNLYITGVTFYNNPHIENNYIENYMVNEGKTCNVFAKDKEKHNIKENIKYLKRFIKYKGRTTISPELQKIIYV
jgi:hypothetical protein